MIRSKVKTYGFWITPIMIIFVIAISIFTFLKDPVIKDLYICSAWAFVMLLLLIPQLWITCRLIVIDTSNSTITFMHFFTGHHSVYKFTDIDGYVDMIEKPARGRPFRVLYLVRDERLIQKISSFIYSNIDEIEQGLKATEYLGKQNYSFLKQCKILLGQKVLNK